MRNRPIRPRTRACATADYPPDCPKRAFEFPIPGSNLDRVPLAHELPIERQREIARSAFDNPEEFDPSLMQGVYDPNEAPSDRDVARFMEQYAGKEGAPAHEAVAEAIKQFRDTEKALGGREAFDKARAAGKTKLNYAQWVQVRTPNFKRWFGDWENENGTRNNGEGVSGQPAEADAGAAGDAGRSWRLDPETGEPRVWYHGTRDDFDAFDLDHPNKKDHGWLGRGAYLASSESMARAYANLKPGAGKPRVMALFTNVRDPLPATLADKQALRFATAEESAEFSRRAMADGHDGVLLPFAGGDFEAVAFRPEQIKSATANVGTFDEHTANTLFQTAWHGTAHRGIERFSLQKIGTGEGAQAYGWGLYFASKREVAEEYRQRLSNKAGIVATIRGKSLNSYYDAAEREGNRGSQVGYDKAD